MPIEHKLIRIESPDDPRRCKSVGSQQQCPYQAAPGSNFCSRHGAHKQTRKQEQENIRMYKLSKWKARMEEFADHPEVKGLRNEIGILRMTLEECLNRCQDADELFLMSNKISDIVVKIEKLVVSCHKLEQSSGQLLDKTAALNFATQIVDIVAKNVDDPVIIDNITGEILQTLAKQQSLEETA